MLMTEHQDITSEASEYEAGIATGEQINSLLEEYPGGFGFSIHDLDQIATGQNLPSYQKLIDLGIFMDSFLVAANWWVRVARAFFNGPHEFVDEAKICDAMREIFKLYPGAFEATFTIDDMGSNTAALEMLQAYWRLRDLICSSVRKELPGANVEMLCRLA